jgi:thioredoxin 1
MTTELTEKTYYTETAKSEGKAIVQFTAPWCGPCRMLSPRLQELESDGLITYFRVDVDQNPELALDFKVMSIPTLQFYKDGQYMKTSVGAVTKSSLVAELEKL